MEIRLNYVTLILIALLIKTGDFYEDIADDVEEGLIQVTMIKMIKDRYQ